MNNIPDGTVTFLFTDIEGGTMLAQKFPDIYPDLLTRHHEILHVAIKSNNGYVFEIVGYAFCAAFENAYIYLRVGDCDKVYEYLKGSGGTAGIGSFS